ncbi:type IV toxin-antitoxin system AbiEi family antitoxin domain-containing protein [Mycolicibacterium peregrinum]|uniref:type IV toxin-antitoxin system AbiEi family antitoxin domain-containing protein n=1 Tax=Mycolicibacterium peregrinum TaxID=43304 RepID=UPI000A6B8183|nr:type IV toxin-antitoxin system AbiEi family antitoxin domain-containing protein [Mycolicibacterium peregrinum]
MSIELVDVDDVLRQQDGVISRRQALDAGLREHEIRRLLRRNEWARVHAGVYVDHTGPLTWAQCAWAAVLYAAPAALCFDSALGAETLPIHVAVARHRTVLNETAGVRIHHLEHLRERVLWNVGPPRLRYDEAALDVACRAESELDAIAVLANACQSRRTTAHRLLQVLDSRARVRRRRWLRAVLVDIADGTCSVLEHGYLVRVERAHGLPKATRQ